MENVCLLVCLSVGAVASIFKKIGRHIHIICSLLENKTMDSDLVDKQVLYRIMFRFLRGPGSQL